MTRLGFVDWRRVGSFTNAAAVPGGVLVSVDHENHNGLVFVPMEKPGEWVDAAELKYNEVLRT